MRFSLGVRQCWAYYVWKISEHFKIKGGFPPYLTPQDLIFKDLALSLLYTYGSLTSCTKLEKTDGPSLRYFKTDRLTDRLMDGQTLFTFVLDINSHNVIYSSSSSIHYEDHKTDLKKL